MRVGTSYVRNLLEFGGWDLELFLATELLRLRSLHYGYWDQEPKPAQLTLTALREAQARFTERLLAFFPEGITSVLDVGAGIGDNARAMSLRGYSVTSLSPDKNHRRYFDPLKSLGVAFYPSRFEDLSLSERFSLVFISEALNYFDREIGLAQCKRYTRERGYLLVAAMFRYQKGRTFGLDEPLESLPYVSRAASYGFELVASSDITKNVAPTIDLAHKAFETYAHPVLSLLSGPSTKTTPKWLPGPLRRARERLAEITRYYARRLDPQYFRNHVRYAVLLFQRTD
jgi:MPBQ/MSBQ methyltransferase